MKQAVCIAVAMLSLAAGSAQNSHPPADATVTYDTLWEDSTPQKYMITVKASGEARYQSSNPTKPNPEDLDFDTRFTISAENVKKIFDLAAELNYFHGDFDFKDHPVAFTGKKTLSYNDASRHFQTTYNWSTNKSLEQITQIFQGIASTLQHGRKLQYLHRYDRLGLEAELKFMEEEAKNHQLAELQVISPDLQSIVDDYRVMHIARQRARRLLRKAGVPVAEAQ